MQLQYLNAVFLLAGIEIIGLKKIPNGYYPEAYKEEADEKYPWWIVTTSFGDIKIGWRKRVISIDWSRTSFRGIVTEDEVTKDLYMVHAYGYPMAAQYLRALSTLPQNGGNAVE